jgi:hypothetical protein
VEKKDVAFSKFIVEIRQKAKKKKRVSIFSKSAAEKISSTVCQGILKEQKQNSEVCKADY